MIVKCSESDLGDGGNGGCTSCGNVQYGGVEPDARKYKCECCGKNTLYGLEELLVAGHLRVEDEE
jgi:hypothetical protein